MAAQCNICGNEHSFLSLWNTKDNFNICSNCIKRVSRGDRQFNNNLEEHSREIHLEEWRDYIQNPGNAQKWNYTDKPIITKIGDVIFDDNHQIIKIPYLMNSRYREYTYSQIYKYKYMENHKMVSTGGSGIGRAIVGGMLFGPAGAVVGAVTKNRSLEEMASNMSIEIVFLVNEETVIEKIKISDFIDGNMSVDSWTYERYIKRVEKILHKLDEVYELSHQPDNLSQASLVVSSISEEHTAIGDINFRFSDKQSLTETGSQIWENICAFLRCDKNTINSYVKVIDEMAKNTNSISTKTTNTQLFNKAVERISDLITSLETLLFFVDEGLISQKAKVGYFVTDRHIFFLKKKKILTFDLETLYMIESGRSGKDWYLNDSTDFTISYFPLCNLRDLSIIMALILQLHANIAGSQNSILMEGF